MSNVRRSMQRKSAVKQETNLSPVLDGVDGQVGTKAMPSHRCKVHTSTCTISHVYLGNFMTAWGDLIISTGLRAADLIMAAVCSGARRRRTSYPGMTLASSEGSQIGPSALP